MLTESQVWLAEKSQSGFLVALWVPSSTAEKLAISGGEPAAELHVTLAICGEASDIPELAQARIITAIADTVMYRDKLEGTISGYGRFQAPEDEPEAQDVFYVTPDIPRLAELRQEIVNCLMSQGVPVNATHGFTPHITLAYLDPGSDNPVSEVETLPLVFDAVTIMAGSRRIDIPFWEPEPATSMYTEEADLPLDAPVDVHPLRQMLGDFNKEWIPFLPKPGKYQRDSENLNLTTETYEQILKNFDNYVYKQDLPIRATHTPSDGGAVGWIRPGGMRLADDGSIEVKPEWNELGKGLVDDDRFRYVSAEYCKVWTNPVTQEKIPNVAVGLALVTRPHFKTDVLNPLSEGEAKAFAEASPHIAPSGDVESTEKTAFVSVSGGVEPIIDEVAAGDGGTDMSDTQKLSDQLAPSNGSTDGVAAVASGGASTGSSPVTGQGTNPLDPNQKLVLQDLGSVVITAEQRRQERQLFADLESRVELAERRATNAEAELANLRKTSLKEKFTAEVLGRSAENGRAWFGDPKENIEHLVSLAEKYGENSTEVQWAVKQKRSEANAIIGTGIFEPIAHQSTDTSATANAQIQRYAEEYRKSDPNLSEEAAIVKAYDEHPDLYLLTIKK